MRRELKGRHVALALAIFVCSPCPAQTWDKYLAPGFTYRMEVDSSIPRVIHAIRFSPQSKAVWSKPELAGLKVYSEDASKERQTISELVKQTGALGGLNGDFFPYTGDPLGFMVRDGELISAPWPKRAIFAWGKKGGAGGVPTLALRGQNGSLGAIEVDGFNQTCGPNQVVINTPAAGFARSKGEGLHIVLKRASGDWKTNSRWAGTVEQVVRAEKVPVPEDGAVLTSTSTHGPDLGMIQLGNPVSFQIESGGLDWTKFDQAIGGGPFLVKKGALSVDWDYQGFKPSFATKRHSRTAVGRTASGDLWWVVIDGRQKISVGATLEELARVMLKYGCVDAVNLDGGGSTTINLLGLTLNSPSDGYERRVANGVLFFGEPAKVASGSIVIKVPEKMYVGVAQPLRIFTSAGLPVPNANVLWQAGGAGWIDQGGLVRPTAVGRMKVTAWSEGRVASTEFDVGEKPKPMPPPPAKKKKKTTKRPRRS